MKHEWFRVISCFVIHLLFADGVRCELATFINLGNVPAFRLWLDIGARFECFDF